LQLQQCLVEREGGNVGPDFNTRLVTHHWSLTAHLLAAVPAAWNDIGGRAVP
jgi:hypothetical protein